MKILDNEIEFEYLYQPSRNLIGEKESIKAKVPSFVSPNAEGSTRSVDSLNQVLGFGENAVVQLSKLFN